MKIVIAPPYFRESFWLRLRFPSVADEHLGAHVDIVQDDVTLD